jgi:hypothetical protein
MVKLTPDLIEGAGQYINPIRDRELDLRSVTQPIGFVDAQIRFAGKIKIGRLDNKSVRPNDLLQGLQDTGY